MSEIQMGIAERVTKIVSEKLAWPKAQIRLESTIVNDLGADSLDLLELVMSVEDEFGIEIQDAEADKILTVKQLIDSVTAKV